MEKLTDYLGAELNLSSLDKMKLKYSMETIFNDLSKIFILFILFSFLDKTSDFIYSVLALMTIRPFTGGLHFKTYSGCLTFTGIFFTTSIVLKNNIQLSNIILIAFVFSFMTIFLLAPITSKNRPSYSNQKKLQFKLKGLCVITIHFIAYIIVNKNPYLANAIWVFILQSIQLLIKKGVEIYEKKNESFQQTT